MPVSYAHARARSCDGCYVNPQCPVVVQHHAHCTADSPTKGLLACALLPCLQEIEVSTDGTSYTTVARCPIHFVLTHENKGFEGLHLHEHDDHRILMGLCEGEVW